MPYIDLVGKSFGKWEVLSRAPQKKVVYYLCKCACGVRREVLSVSLRNGKSVSCGCSKNQRTTVSIRRANPSTYNSWAGMKQRCNDKNHVEFHRYGGRGITYNARWNDFDSFLSDMGPKPRGMSLDRIDNDLPYSKENCRWSSPEEQMSNTSRNIVVEWGGKRFTLKRLAKHLGISYDRLHKWHRDIGLPIREAVSRASEPTA